MSLDELAYGKTYTTSVRGKSRPKKKKKKERKKNKKKSVSYLF